MPIPNLSRFFWLPCLVLPLFAVSCAPLDPNAPVPRASHVMYQWHDDGGPGEVTVSINLAEQKAFFARGGRPIGWSYVATGKEGHGTTPGRYSITEKIVDKHSNRYGWIEDDLGNVTDGDAKPSDPVPPGQKYVAAPMPYWMRITNYGIGMHGGIIPNPGEPASHGCIRLPHEFVPTLFDSVRVGTPVRINY